MKTKAETEWSIEWVWDTQRRNNYRGKGKPLIWTALFKTFFAFHLISLRYFCFVKSPHVAKNLKERPKNKNESPAYLSDVEMEADVRSCLLPPHTHTKEWMRPRRFPKGDYTNAESLHTAQTKTTTTKRIEVVIQPAAGHKSRFV
jgi:hypothetical protein